MRGEKFGAKSEKLRPDQYYLPLEDVENRARRPGAAQERAEAVIQGQSRSVPDQGSHRNRGCLPAHLPRLERIIEPASTLCPCGCGDEDRRGRQQMARRDPGAMARAGHRPPEIHLPPLLGSCRADARTGTCRAWWTTPHNFAHLARDHPARRHPSSQLPPAGEMAQRSDLTPSETARSNRNAARTMPGILEGSNRSRVADLAASPARDLFEAGLNEAASCERGPMGARSRRR